MTDAGPKGAFLTEVTWTDLVAIERQKFNPILVLQLDPNGDGLFRPVIQLREIGDETDHSGRDLILLDDNLPQALVSQFVEISGSTATMAEREALAEALMQTAVLELELVYHKGDPMVEARLAIGAFQTQGRILAECVDRWLLPVKQPPARPWESSNPYDLEEVARRRRHPLCRPEVPRLGASPYTGEQP